MPDLDKSQTKCCVTSLLRQGWILVFMCKKIAFAILLPILEVAARETVSLKHKMNYVILFDGWHLHLLQAQQTKWPQLLLKGKTLLSLAFKAFHILVPPSRDILIPWYPSYIEVLKPVLSAWGGSTPVQSRAEQRQSHPSTSCWCCAWCTPGAFCLPLDIPLTYIQLAIDWDPQVSFLAVHKCSLFHGYSKCWCWKNGKKNNQAFNVLKQHFYMLCMFVMAGAMFCIASVCQNHRVLIPTLFIQSGVVTLYPDALWYVPLTL